MCIRDRLKGSAPHLQLARQLRTRNLGRLVHCIVASGPGTSMMCHVAVVSYCAAPYATRVLASAQ
eukprot:1844679-Pyramimonas_sp.AAC.1